MATLAFDTCLGACSAAVRWRSGVGEWLVREAYEERREGHAEILLPMIRDVLAGAGLAFTDIDRIAVTVGPGLFTGVRTGIAAARAFALALARPVVGLSSLAVMAHRADGLIGAERGGRALLVAVDARRESVYVQPFGENVGEPLAEPQLLAVSDAARLVPEREPLIVGSGAALVAAAMGEAGRSAEARLPRLEPHARALVMLAPVLRPLDAVRPLYLRAPDAKPPAERGPRGLN